MIVLAMPLLTPVLKPVMVEEVLGKTLIRLEILEVLVTSLICFWKFYRITTKRLSIPSNERANINVDVTLEFEEAAFGVEKKLNIQE